VPKPDDVGKLLHQKREIKGKVKAVGDVVVGESFSEVAPGVTDKARVGGDDVSYVEKPIPGALDARAYLDVVIMVLVGSTTAPAARYIVHSLPLPWIPVLRFGLAGLCLGPLVWARGGLGRLVRQDGWLLVLAAALCVPINQGFFLSATKLGLVSHVGLFYATCPLVVLLLAWGFRMEQPDFARLTGVLLSVLGIVVIGIGHYWEQSSHSGGVAQSVVFSDLLLLGAVTSWGAYIAVSKPLVVRHGAMTVLAGTVLTGWILSLPFAFWEPLSLSSLGQVPASAWLALLFLGVFITPFAWAYQNLALRRFDASQVATFSNASPILTVVWGMWLFGEVLTPTLVAGGAMTLGGIYWACRPRRDAQAVKVARRERAVRRQTVDPAEKRIPAVPGLVLAKEVVAQ
jgi:drug/metabolite transporter (DMT)-like permease